eukprot:1137360-Pelagomonas_calceolata.AAC.5
MEIMRATSRGSRLYPEFTLLQENAAQPCKSSYRKQSSLASYPFARESSPALQDIKEKAVLPRKTSRRKQSCLASHPPGRKRRRHLPKHYPLEEIAVLLDAPDPKRVVHAADLHAQVAMLLVARKADNRT